MRLMFIIFVCLFAISHSYHVESLISARIIGGRDAKSGEFPHQVSVQFGGPPILPFMHLCGGAVLTDQWILTTAHCAPSKSSNFIVKAGKRDLYEEEDTEQEVAVESYYIHEKFNNSNPEAGSSYNIALLKLKNPLKFKKSVGAIGLPRPNSEPTGVAVMSGWGGTTNQSKPIISAILQTVEVPIIERDVCNRAIEKLAEEVGVQLNETFVQESNVCTGPLTGGISACLGDSGDPLIVKTKDGRTELIGLALYAFDPCGRKGAPTVFVKISSYVQWIMNIAAEH